MRQAIGFVVCVMLLGCSGGSNTVPDGGVDGGSDGSTSGGPDYTSGTRLRAKVYASADGARQWHGWFDQQLQTSCAVTTAEDDVLRCVPTGAYYSTDTFADSACTEPVATSLPACEAPPSYALQNATSGCANIAYAIGAKVVPAAVWTNQGGGCQPATPEPTVDYYRVGAKVDPATFVKETRTREARGPELQVQFFVGEDGSKQPNGLFDSTRKGACATVYLPLDSYAGRCVPSHVGYAEQTYSDSTCKTPAINIIPPGTCYYAADDLATAAWIYEEVGCQGAHLSRFAEIGAQQTGPLYRLTGSTCALENNPPAQWNAIGAEILPSTFPLLSYSQSGQGRIIDDWYTAASSDKLTVDGFYDTQLKIACDPKLARDGKLRCIPRALDTTVFYLDDKCTSAVYANDGGSSCTPTPPPATIRAQRPSTCESQVGHYTVGAKIATPTNVWQVNGTCDPSFVSPTADYYALTETDPATLVELTDVKE